MRYRNWDVRLFRGDSKASVQEFQTQRLVFPDQDSPCLKPPYFDPQLFNADLSMIQLSVQTCFVSDLHPLATFRLSIQSEEEPRPSPLVQRCIPPGCCFLLQVAVYEGGVCIGGSLFEPCTSWPVTLRCRSQGVAPSRPAIDGRLRVVISEGFSRPWFFPPFERVKDIVMFDFWSAPQSILRPTPPIMNANSGELPPTINVATTTRQPTTESNGGQLINNAYYSIIPRLAAPPVSVVNWPNLGGMDLRLGLLHPTNFGSSSFQTSNNGFMGASDPLIEPMLAYRLRQTQRSTSDTSMPDAGPQSVRSLSMSSVNGFYF